MVLVHIPDCSGTVVRHHYCRRLLVQCGSDGSACAGCAYPTWYSDGYCDDGSNNTAECGYDGGD